MERIRRTNREFRIWRLFRTMVRHMKTKYGNAKINNTGYYVITSSTKKENIGKSLHRLVFEDYHDCKLDKNDEIHHIDFDKLNNHPTNLTCMSKKAHRIIHNKNKILSDETKQKLREINTGKTLSDETKNKISESHKDKPLSDEHKQSISKSTNTSGYLNVYKQKNKECKQGFVWCYRYHDENGKRKAISSVDINKLETKVKSKGLKWRKLE